MALESLEFDLTLEEVPVTLNKNGCPWECVLREMDGYARDLYLNSQRDKMEMNSRNVKNFTDVQTSLIVKCLFDKNTNEPVPAARIREFPSKVQMKLYNICMELCGFNEEAEKAAKNS